MFSYIVTLLTAVPSIAPRRTRQRLLIALVSAVLIATVAGTSTSDVVPADPATPNLGRRAAELGVGSVQLANRSGEL
jgi:hypothetical protein